MTQTTTMTMTRLLCAGALLASPVLGQAFSGITDNANDLLATFGGSAAASDLDVISASVFYDAGTDFFTLVSTMSGPIGLTPLALYVWGVNRGNGVASFAANGIDGVRFDRVITLRADGSGTISGVGALPAGAVTVSGATLTARVAGTALPSTGFVNKLDYTWNLWPRDTAFAGFAAIADFAPDNANFTTTPVPEPGSYALMLAGLGAVGWVAARRARNAANARS